MKLLFAFPFLLFAASAPRSEAPAAYSLLYERITGAMQLPASTPRSADFSEEQNKLYREALYDQAMRDLAEDGAEEPDPESPEPH